MSRATLKSVDFSVKILISCYCLTAKMIISLKLPLETRVSIESWGSEQGQGQCLGSGLRVEVRVNVQGQGYCLGLGLALSVRVSASDQVRVKVRTHQGQRSERPKKTTSSFEIYCMNQYLNQVIEQCHTEHCLRHVNKTACEIWSISGKVHF